MELKRASENGAMFADPKESMDDRKQFVENLGWLMAQTREGIVGAYLDDKDGNKRRSAEVVADSCYFGDSKKDGDNSGGSYGGNSYNASGYGAPGYSAPPAYPQSNFEVIEDDDAQLPF